MYGGKHFCMLIFDSAVHISTSDTHTTIFDHDFLKNVNSADQIFELKYALADVRSLSVHVRGFGLLELYTEMKKRLNVVVFALQDSRAFHSLKLTPVLPNWDETKSRPEILEDLEYRFNRVISTFYLLRHLNQCNVNTAYDLRPTRYCKGVYESIRKNAAYLR